MFRNKTRTREKILHVAMADPLSLADPLLSLDDEPLSLLERQVISKLVALEGLALAPVATEDDDVVRPFVRRQATTGTLKNLLANEITEDREVQELSELFDFAGVRRHEKALLDAMRPGQYRRRINANVQLPRAVELLDTNVQLPRAVELLDITSHVDACGVLEELIHLECYRWIEYFAEDERCRNAVCETAALLGNLNVLQFAVDRQYPWNRDTSINAVRHLEVLRYAVDAGCPFDRWTAAAAAAIGALDALKHLVLAKPTIIDGMVSAAAARGGHLTTLQWLYSNNREDPDRIASSAARGGHLHILEWLVDEDGVKLSSRVTAAAAGGGSLRTLRWLHDHGCPWDSLTSRRAAERGHLAMLEYCHQQGCPVTSDATFMAAKGDHLAALRFLVDRQCPITPSACTAAAETGAVDCLKFLLAEGVALDDHFSEGAARGGNLALFQWALSKKTCFQWGSRTTYWAALLGHQDILTYALDQGCPFHDRTFAAAASKGSIDILELLAFKVGLPTSPDAAEAAAANGHVDVLAWLRDHKCPFSDNVSRQAIYAGRADVLAYLAATGFHIAEAP